MCHFLLRCTACRPTCGDLWERRRDLLQSLWTMQSQSTLTVHEHEIAREMLPEDMHEGLILHPAIWTCSDSSGCSVTRLVQAHPVPDRERTSAFASWTLSRSALQRTNTVLKNCYGNPFWPMHLHGITIIQNGPSLILSIPLNRQSKSMNLFTLN